MVLVLPKINLGLSILAIILSLLCLWQFFSLRRLKKTFFAGTKALNLESVIYSLKQELKDSQQQQAELERVLLKLKKDFSFSLQKLGLVRFNPFNDGGGNFSFCLALLDEHDSGVVLTSMYGREQNRIYSKKINQGQCETPLTEEEQGAIQKAQNKS